MARSRTPSPAYAPAKTLSADEIRAAIARLNKRIAELRAVDLPSINEWRPDSLVALEAAIEQTLDRAFGSGTADRERYAAASELTYSEYVGIFVIGGPPQPKTPISEVRTAIGGKVNRAVTLLSQAIEGLSEDLAHLPEAVSVTLPKLTQAVPTKVFIVHGHSETAREIVARFIQQMGFEPVILHQQHNGGRTIIEKIEHHGDVGFAIVLLTPDDIGGVSKADLAPRARQNVILELGYFIGRLGRDKVCALKAGELEVPSDYHGVVYQVLDAAGGWKVPLARELQGAGYSVDWGRIAHA
ncbi:TIR domain-containing protein [Brevundimonas diminuta]